MANAKKSSILNRMKLAGFQSSTKIEALREELALMLAQDPSAKALVFSQFTSMLDLIYYRLQQVRQAPLERPVVRSLSETFRPCH